MSHEMQLFTNKCEPFWGLNKRDPHPKCQYWQHNYITTYLTRCLANIYTTKTTKLLHHTRESWGPFRHKVTWNCDHPTANYCIRCMCLTDTSTCLWVAPGTVCWGRCLRPSSVLSLSSCGTAWIMASSSGLPSTTSASSSSQWPRGSQPYPVWRHLR